MRAELTWRGRKHAVEGALDSVFMIVDGQVMTRLLHVQPPLEGNDDTDVWVPAQSLRSAGAPPTEEVQTDGTTSFILRSDMRELPADQARDYALRTVSLTLSEFVGTFGVHIALYSSVATMNELSFTMAVPARDATAYLWKFQTATRQCRTRPALWTPPPVLLAEASLQQQDRPNAAHYTGQLPLWLTTRRYWSVFRWHDGCLQHIVQFSLQDKWQRTLLRRFRMKWA